MRRVIIIFLWVAVSSIIFSGVLFAPEKGIRLKKEDGTDVVLFKNSYALLIGCWQYQHWRPFKKETFEKEINDLEKSLTNHGFRVFKHLNLPSFQFETVIENFKNDYGYDEDNRLLFFFSGHGANIEGSPMGYIVPVDATLCSQNLKEFLRKSYSLERFKTIAKEIWARQALFVFDCCASGSIFQVKGPIDTVPKNISKEMAFPVRKFITAGRGKENVPEISIFTPGFIRGIEGAADFTGDGFVTGQEMFLFIKSFVEKHDAGHHPQVGSIMKPGELYEGDFVFALGKTATMPPPPFKIDTREQQAWSEWQKELEQGVERLKEIDSNKYIAPSVKIFNWKKLLEGYKADNPYSDQDEALKEYIKKRITYWEREAGPGKTKIPLPDSPKSFSKKINNAAKISKNPQGYWEGEYRDGIVMIYIPEGEFIMGSDDGDADEGPQRNVYLDGYWIGKYEVTVKQFRMFVQAGGYVTDAEKAGWAFAWDGKSWRKKKGANWMNPGFTQDDRHPVVYVSWNDATAYCNWLSDKTGLIFKLPTEAQWEKAGRSIDGRKYPWGDHKPHYKNRFYANYAVDNSWERKGDDGYEFTAPVGTFPLGASAFGVLDTAGNVWEWCRDWYSENYYYKYTHYKNPTGPPSGLYHVLRGGGWNLFAADIRCISRYLGTTTYCHYDTGFRLQLQNN